MSFGYSIGDAILLTQLAWKTVQNARKACGEHDELTREVSSLHVVIRRLEKEVRNPDCPINRPHDTYEEELAVLVNGCEKNLNVLDQVLTKYNALSEQERSGRRLWQKIRFGNGKVSDLADLRAKLTYYTSAMSFFLNMVSMGTMGRVERQLNDAGGDLKEIKFTVNEIIGQLVSKSSGHEGSILTAYADDDRAVWKQFRRELVRDGFSSSVIKKHKQLIKDYIEELGSRGLLDEVDPDEDAEERMCDGDSVVEADLKPESETQYHSPEASHDNTESSINSKVPQDLHANTNLASYLQTEPGDGEGPSEYSSSSTDSQTSREAELRWVWLRDDYDGDNPKAPAEDTRTPSHEPGTSTSIDTGDKNRNTDPQTILRESIASFTPPASRINDSYHGSDSKLLGRRTAKVRERNTTEPSSTSDKFEVKNHDYWLERKQAAARDHIRRAREAALH